MNDVRGRVIFGFDALLAELKANGPRRKQPWRPGSSLSPEENARLDAYIADPNTPDRDDDWTKSER